ncbi:beta-N-acetylhexosaminidase [Kordiimonas marina]|uniref:beta-N-acetylhexosaminidase n=1 Tax=Kordiimonas marina TaxID=2872312 RepID=UPI001FF321A6|nr:beta-N-acetylhexosaminidase [Kordiimonas marina]MCJ9430251.1 beta-N-acetylhexosaminidase [Kordiimonas marina]
MIPVIFGCSGTSLTATERAFFGRIKPAGFILFARNIESPDQVRVLVRELKESVGRTKVPILIDQEGGRVQRLKAPHWRAYPPMATFGDMAAKDPTLAASALRLNCRMIADDLRRLGINVDCLPVLDLPQGDADPIIGDRAFSHDPDLVAALGRIAVDALMASGVLPVIKHIPGHGRATQDSHLALPVVDTPLADLQQKDFVPFKALKDAPFAMTAHIVYSDIDAREPATLSRVVIGRVIRMSLGFSGLLMSDDLSMKALSGDFAARTKGALEAGCDLVLHCNGDMDEMQAVASACPPAAQALEKRLATLISQADKMPMADRGDIRARYDALMAKF